MVFCLNTPSVCTFCQSQNCSAFVGQHYSLLVVVWCFFFLCTFIIFFPFQVSVALSVNIFSHRQLDRNALTAMNKRGILRRSPSRSRLSVASVRALKKVEIPLFVFFAHIWQLNAILKCLGRHINPSGLQSDTFLLFFLNI